MKFRLIAALIVSMLGATLTAADASAGSISSFSSSSYGSIAFQVTDMTASALAGSQTFTYSLTGSTGPSGASITVMAPTIVGDQGNTLPRGAFSVTCAKSIDHDGTFVSSGTVNLAAGTATCATFAPDRSVNVTFTLTLTLNDTSESPYAFPSALRYTEQSPLFVTANFP